MKRDTTEKPPKYLVFFKARDGDALNAAFREYVAVAARKKARPSVLQKLRRINPLEKIIPKNIPISQTEDFVCKALEHYNKYLRNRAERDSR